MLKYDTYLCGKNPKTLVFFLHGYNSTVATHQYAIDWLKDKLNDAVLVVPYAPESSDKNPDRRQWFGMLKHDAEDLRTRPETSVETIFAIYNKAADDINRCSILINRFIDDVQKIYHLPDSHTFLCGFSQGAMLTIYAALTRKKPLKGAFVLSGLVAGADLLATKISAQPPLYMFHGQDDMKVQYKTLTSSESWLKNHQIPLKVKTYADLAHRMIAEEMAEVADIINADN